MTDAPKGRRASERRREQSGGEEPVEATTPGKAAPDGELYPDDEAQTAALDGAPLKQKREKTRSVTSMTSVGNASKEALKQEPLERTKVRQWEESPEPLAAKLICLEGKDVGKSFDLDIDRLVVGRSKEANIRLSDPAMSRNHFELRYDLARNLFYFIPKVTDPAPTINGEEAAGSERELADGDVIEVGETQLRFVRVEGPPPKPREPTKIKDPTMQVPVVKEKTFTDQIVILRERIRSNAGLAKKVLGVGIALLVVVGVAGVFGISAWRKAAHESELNDPSGAYQKLLAQAKELRDSRRWEELAATGGALTRLAPERDDGRKLEKEARDEQTAEKNLNLGRMNYTSGQYDAARSVLRLISDESVYRAERDKLLEQAGEVGRSGSIAAIQQLIAQGRYKEAAERSEQHLATYRDDEEARSLRAQSQRQSAAKEAMGSPAWQGTRTRIIGALDSGDISGALAMAEAATGGGDSSHATAMANKLRALQSEWKKGKDLLGKKSAKAIEPLQKARDLEDDISGGRTSMTKDIKKALGDGLYLAGIDALGAGKECDARGLFDRALVERGSDPKVTDKLSRIAAHGREMLGQAEAARARGDKAQSTKLAKEALCRLPKGEDDRARAEKLAAGKG